MAHSLPPAAMASCGEGGGLVVPDWVEQAARRSAATKTPGFTRMGNFYPPSGGVHKHGTFASRQRLLCKRFELAAVRAAGAGADVMRKNVLGSS